MSETNGNGKANSKPENGESTSNGDGIEGTLEKEWATKFLDELKVSANVSNSCFVAGISTTHVYRERDKDAAFKAAWHEALERGISSLEVELRRRALSGVERTYHDKDGNVTSTETKYSDVLGMFLLKAHRPKVYRENIHVDTNHTGEISFNFQGMTQKEARDSVRDRITDLLPGG